MKIKTSEFVMSNSDVTKCPNSQLPEYAFIGRSNVGKSSLINMLTDRNSLAKVSGKPGKTRLINHFLINDSWHLVDLPGYGYAKVSEKIKKLWQIEMELYLTTRECLSGIVLLIDPRHNLKEYDCLMIELAIASKLNLHILLTKADKLNNKERSDATKMIESFLTTFKTEGRVSYQLFSSHSKMGLDKFKEKLDEWYEG
jgi:GTP-binding protein